LQAVPPPDRRYAKYLSEHVAHGARRAAHRPERTIHHRDRRRARVLLPERVHTVLFLACRDGADRLSSCRAGAQRVDSGAGAQRRRKKILAVIDRRPESHKNQRQEGPKVPRAFAGGDVMNNFIGRHPIWSLAIVIGVAVLLFLIFAVWPPELEQAIGRKRLFLSALLNGITLGGLYFLVASGFTLIFGLMRNVNLAHGSLYLFGGYLGYEVAVASGSWILTLLVVFIVVALLGIVLQFTIFRWMEGQDLRQTLVTIALSLILADLMLWRWGGDFYQVPPPPWLAGPIEIPLVTAMRSSGEDFFLSYPLV